MKRMAPLLLVAGLASTAHAAPAAEASQSTVAPPTGDSELEALSRELRRLLSAVAEARQKHATCRIHSDALSGNEPPQRPMRCCIRVPM